MRNEAAISYFHDGLILRRLLAYLGPQNQFTLNPILGYRMRMGWGCVPDIGFCD